MRRVTRLPPRPAALPEDFTTKLRQKRLGRKIPILMCITIYNVRKGARGG